MLSIFSIGFILIWSISSGFLMPIFVLSVLVLPNYRLSSMILIAVGSLLSYQAVLLGLSPYDKKKRRAMTVRLAGVLTVLALHLLIQWGGPDCAVERILTLGLQEQQLKLHNVVVSSA